MPEKITTMNKLRAGVIGVGHLGRFHAEKYRQAEGVELAGVYDIDAERARQIAAGLEVPAVDRLDELFRQCQAVSIATPTVTHFEIARQALENGLDVLVEKPITTTVKEAEELVRLARERERILQVGLLERFNPVFTECRSHLKNPRFIEVHRLSPFSFRSLDIDVILDLMIHDLDLVHEITQSSITSVDAVGVPVISRQTDIANVRIHFASGAVANLTASRVSLNRERRIRIFQPDGYFSLDFSNFSATICRREAPANGNPLPQVTARELKFPEGDNLLLEIEDFLAAVRSRRAPQVSGEDGLRVLKSAVRIKEVISQQQSSWL